MRHLARVILALSVFLIPLLTASSEFGFEQIKVLFFIVSITLIGFIWRGKGFKWTGISQIAGVFILILLITSLTGIDPQTSILGTQPYFQGFILYAYLFLFSLIVSWSKIKFEYWTYILAGSGALVGFIAIKDWVFLNIFGQSIPTYAGRVVSSFGQPNFYAGFLLLILPFCYRLGRFGLLGGLVSAIGILISYSRSAILLLFFLIILALIDQFKVKFKRTGVFLVTILIVIFASFFVSFRFSSGLVWTELQKPINSQWLIDNSPEKRIFIWPVIGKLIAQKPLAGYGLENMQTAFSNFFKEVNFNINNIPYYYSLKDLIVDRSHNYILDLAFFSGVFGLLGWLGLVGLLLKKARGALLISLILYLIWIQFQNQSVVHLIYFWLLVGLVDT